MSPIATELAISEYRTMWRHPGPAAELIKILVIQAGYSRDPPATSDQWQVTDK